MASAKQCDRCGEFYTERERNPFDDLADAMASIVTPKTVLSNIAVIEKFLDLCPRCSRSLRKWVTNAGADESRKEEEEDGK